MAMAPTAEEAARHILEILAHKHNRRAGEGAVLGSFYAAFNISPWHASDLMAGINHGTEQGWLGYENGFVKLTEAGFAEA